MESGAEAARRAREGGGARARPGAQADEAARAAHPRRGRPRAAQDGAAGAPGAAGGHAGGARAAGGRAGRCRRVSGHRADEEVTRAAAVMTVGQRRRLTAVARGEAPADLYVRGGPLLNVYTGEIYPANVAIAGERIAYVGLRDDMVGARTATLDAADRILVPGYIDPHAHPAHLGTPSALARHLLPLGTTTVFADTLQFWELGGLRAFRTIADALATAPLKFYWMIRVHAQARSTDEGRRYPPRDLARALDHPWT